VSGESSHPLDRALEGAIRSLLLTRPWPQSVSPNDVARAVGGDGWRPLLLRARAAAARLQALGEIEWTQGGRTVDPATAIGPFRVRRVRPA
jgi:hypothetical protein